MELPPRVVERKAYDRSFVLWALLNVMCECGGFRSFNLGRSKAIDGRPTQEHDAECNACGQRVTLRFDVSAFEDHKEKTAAWVAATLPDADERTRTRVARRIGAPPMTRFTTFVGRLAKDGERMTLLYMQHRIAKALASMPAAEPDPTGGKPVRRRRVPKKRL